MMIGLLPPGTSRRGCLAAALACLALCLVAAAGAQAKPSPESASASIVGGRAAPAGSDPWLAFIEHRGETGVFTCTGSVIAPRLVLTAGHCILTEGGGLATAAGYTVVTGANDVRSATAANVSHVTARLLFPGYDPAENLGDAGLLVLSTPVAAPVLPMANSSDMSLLTPGSEVEVAGWGLTNGQAEAAPSRLQRAQMTIQSREYCTATTAAYLTTFDPARQTCATEPPQFKVATCHGDSGGPVIAQRADGSAVEVGVIDLGDPECSTELPNTFVRVDLISPWAESWIDAVELGAPQPQIAVPTITLPSLGIADAKQLARIVLGEDEIFGSRFEHGEKIRFECQRQRRTKVGCGVSWSQGPDDFFGRIVVFVAEYSSGEGIYVSSRYKIETAKDECLRTKPTCKVTTVSG